MHTISILALIIGSAILIATLVRIKEVGTAPVAMGSSIIMTGMSYWAQPGMVRSVCLIASVAMMAVALLVTVRAIWMRRSDLRSNGHTPR